MKSKIVVFLKALIFQPIFKFFFGVINIYRTHSSHYILEFIATFIYVLFAHPFISNLEKPKELSELQFKAKQQFIGDPENKLLSTIVNNLDYNTDTPLNYIDLVEISTDKRSTHRISFARLVVNSISKRSSFNGTNYYNNGKAYGGWTSNYFKTDIDQSKIEYTYFVYYISGEPSKIGSGEIRYSDISKSLTFGSFRDEGTFTVCAEYYNLEEVEKTVHFIPDLKNLNSRKEFLKRVNKIY